MKTKSKPKSNLDFDSSHPLHQPSLFKFLPLVVLALLLLNLLATCGNTRALQTATKNQPYIYLQTVDGTTLQAQPNDPLFRSEPTIALFASDWLKLAFTWKTPPQKGKAFVTERGIDFPYQFHAASLAIEPGYREAYMDLTAKKYQRQFTFGNYITGQHQSYVQIYESDQPKVQQVEKGVWDVTIVATRTHAAGDSIMASEIFNRVIRIRAIKPNNDAKKLWGDRDTHLGRLLNTMQHDGLQIIQINEF